MTDATAQHGFYFDARRCTGCKTCMLACKDYHNLPVETSFRQVYEFSGGSWEKDEWGSWRQNCFAYYVSVACNHCADPACIKVCPTGAMHKGDYGLVSVDAKRCIGCGYCALSCPYRAPKVDRGAGHSVKCDGCADRVAGDKKPVCVEACPVRALEFGPIDDLRRDHGSCADVLPLPDQAVTCPNVAINPPSCMEDAADFVREAGHISNSREIV